MNYYCIDIVLLLHDYPTSFLDTSNKIMSPPVKFTNTPFKMKTEELNSATNFDYNLVEFSIILLESSRRDLVRNSEKSVRCLLKFHHQRLYK